MCVVIYDPREGRLSMRGHAGAGEKGSDLVCAALTILMETAAAQPGSERASGEGWCLIEGEPGRLAPLAVGLRLLARDFPEHVRYREASV